MQSCEPLSCTHALVGTKSGPTDRCLRRSSGYRRTAVGLGVDQPRQPARDASPHLGLASRSNCMAHMGCSAIPRGRPGNANSISTSGPPQWTAQHREHGPCQWHPAPLCVQRNSASRVARRRRSRPCPQRPRPLLQRLGLRHPARLDGGTAGRQVATNKAVRCRSRPLAQPSTASASWSTWSNSGSAGKTTISPTPRSR